MSFEFHPILIGQSISNALECCFNFAWISNEIYSLFIFKKLKKKFNLVWHVIRKWRMYCSESGTHTKYQTAPPLYKTIFFGFVVIVSRFHSFDWSGKIRRLESLYFDFISQWSCSFGLLLNDSNQFNHTTDRITSSFRILCGFWIEMNFSWTITHSLQSYSNSIKGFSSNFCADCTISLLLMWSHGWNRAYYISPLHFAFEIFKKLRSTKKFQNYIPSNRKQILKIRYYHKN